jgi:hypothetical protein
MGRPASGRPHVDASIKEEPTMFHDTHPSARRLVLVMVAAVLAAAPAFAETYTDRAKAAAATASKPAAQAPATQAPAAPKTDAAHDAMMAEAAKYASPGPGHDRLKGMAGKWKAVVKTWFAPGEPTVSEGTSENTMVMGGRFLMQKFTGTMQGQPFEGLGLTGYDNQKQEFQNVWVDNMSTGLTMTSGSYVGTNQEMVMKGTMPGPDGKDAPYRMVTKIVDDNKHVFTMSTTMEGKEATMMEITYTRM